MKTPPILLKRLRLLGSFGLVFAAGLVLGGVFGGWFAEQDVPLASIALQPPQPLLQVPVRAYRPPTRGSRENREELRERTDSMARAPLQRINPHVERDKPAAPSEERTVTRLDRADRKPWLANAVAMPPVAGKPMIALVIDDLGIDQRRTKNVLSLPAPLTLAFIPYGYNLRTLTARGREAGHELLVHVNMEPKDRGVDAGPHALLTSLDDSEIRARLRWALTRFDGFVGINNHMGSRFTEWPNGVEIVLQELRSQGLLFLDSLTSQKSVGAALARAHGLPYAARDVFLDNDRTALKIEQRLIETERIARSRGYAIAIGHPHDVTVDALRGWIPDVKRRGFAIVPLTAIVRRRMGEG